MSNLYYYDSWGYLTNSELPGRGVDVEPPEHGEAPVAEQDWPNWTGSEWIMLPYIIPLQSFNPDDELGNPTVPDSVTNRQARMALHLDGSLEAVNNAVASLEGEEGDQARIEWEYSNEVYRNRPLVQAIALLLGWDSQKLDNLFITAASL